MDDVLQREEVRLRGGQGVDGLRPPRAADGAERVGGGRGDSGGGRRERAGGGASLYEGPLREGGRQP